MVARQLTDIEHWYLREDVVACRHWAAAVERAEASISCQNSSCMESTALSKNDTSRIDVLVGSDDLGAGAFSRCW